ncbi:MAG: acyl-CoA dehydrogenase, partial [Streptomyces sp.]|nr:acyl-CoA dehydrogenase [Streptomyces sp.]
MTAVRPRWSDDELEAARDLARTYFEKEVAPHEEKHAAQGHPDKSLYVRAGTLGLLGMSIPEVYGGGGGTFAHLAMLIQEQIRSGGGSMGFAVSEGIVAHYLLAYATEEQKQRWLPKMCSGEWVGSIAMTEPGTGSDLQAIATRAKRVGDEYVVSGAKTFISNGHLCDLLIIAAKTDPSQGAAGISLLVAEVGDDTPGFTRGRILKKVGQKGQDTTELFFDELRIPADQVLGGQE